MVDDDIRDVSHTKLRGDVKCIRDRRIRGACAQGHEPGLGQCRGRPDTHAPRAAGLGRGPGGPLGIKTLDAPAIIHCSEQCAQTRFCDGLRPVRCVGHLEPNPECPGHADHRLILAPEHEPERRPGHEQIRRQDEGCCQQGRLRRRVRHGHGRGRGVETAHLEAQPGAGGPVRRADLDGRRGAIIDHHPNRMLKS